MFQLVRTTYATKGDQRVRKDEQITDNITDVELAPLAEVVNDDDSDQTSRANICVRIINWILGINGDTESSHKKEMEQHTDKLANLEQSTFQRIILYTNLLLIVSIAVFLYVYMSINPFTDEQLTEFSNQAFNLTHLKHYL